MEWDLKTKMIQLGNKRDQSPEDKAEFHKFVLENINTFDGQAWDMFVNLNDLLIDQMKEDINYWTAVYNHIKAVDCNDDKFGFRSGMRIALIQTICEDELGLKL